MRIIAHKGNSSLYPENSKDSILSSYGSSLNTGTELDTLMTKDGVLVVMHWPTLSQISTMKLHPFKPISAYTYQELKDLELTCHFTDTILWEKQIKKSSYIGKQKQLEQLRLLKGTVGSILTLEEALNRLPENKQLLLEIKGYNGIYRVLDHTDQTKFEQVLINTIKPFQHKNIVINGRNMELSAHVAEATHLPLGILVDRKGQAIVDAEKQHIHFDTILANVSCLKDKDLLDLCLAYQCPINLWMIDRLEQFVEAVKIMHQTNLEMGIITNQAPLIYHFQSIFEYESRDIEAFEKKLKR